jgi:dipeptidase E
MLNLVLYSDQIIPENDRIDRRLLDLMQPRGSRIGYVASGPDPRRRFFGERQAYYRRYGLDLALFYDLDAAPDSVALRTLLACDAIHLPGGDTLAFLGRLRRRGMLHVLADWAKAGGLLIGTSAGAILMTPNIAVDALFRGAPPEERPDLDALDLVPFDFFPHAQQQRYLDDLIAYSRTAPRPIIACADGDGVVVTAGRIEAVGAPLWLVGGEAEPLGIRALA